MSESILPLPSLEFIETKAVLKRTVLANRYLAELKGVSRTIPNQGILINTLVLQEAKDSSAIENIITTHDELYKANLLDNEVYSPEAKEVKDYAAALREGFAIISDKKILTCNDICKIQSILEKNDAGFRKQPGTKLVNDKTGEIVYVPPQSHDDILRLMKELEQLINDKDFWPELDPLIKMAVIHFQFESIHPFLDGNGRTGRIINVLYLILAELLEIPILYLSRFIIQQKHNYYRLLQEVREKQSWEEWILFMLDAVIETAQYTRNTVDKISVSMMEYKHGIRGKFNFYSQDLINSLFMHPYTKVSLIERDLKVSRKTASKYLEELSSAGFLERHKYGRSNFYVNTKLFRILSQDESSSQTITSVRTVHD